MRVVLGLVVNVPWTFDIIEKLKMKDTKKGRMKGSQPVRVYLGLAAD